MRQLVSRQIGREEFAFSMENVREILRVQLPKEVPLALELKGIDDQIAECKRRIQRDKGKLK